MKYILLCCTLFLTGILSSEELPEITYEASEFVPNFNISRGVVSSSSSAAVIPMATLEGEPSAIVHHCVNVITGEFTDSHTDLIVHHGVTPLTLDRTYFNQGYFEGSLAPGWHTNHFNELTIKSKKTSRVISIEQAYGGVLKFDFDELKPEERQLKKYIDNYAKYKLADSCLTDGVTNNATGIISGQTNIKNHRVARQNDSYYYTNGKGELKLFLPIKNGDYALQEECFPTGNKFSYHYKKNHVNYYLEKVCLLAGNQSCGDITFPIMNRKELKKELSYQASTQDGRWVRYTYMKAKHSNPLLMCVERAEGPKTCYSYTQITIEKISHNLITKKFLPENRFLKIDYYKNKHNATPTGDCYIDDFFDPRLSRVRTLHAPVGNDATPVPIYHFVYDLNIQKEGKHSSVRKVLNGACEVYNALGYRSRYEFNADHRLTKIHKYAANTSLYATESIYWGEKNTPDYTHLKTRGLQDAQGIFTFIRAYQYDERGNILKDFLYGNLSGSNPIAPTLQNNGTPIENGCECYSKNYVYSNDRNLLLKESDGRHTTTYKYAQNSNLLIAKFQGDEQRCLRRWFYSYNKDGSLAKEINDDGTSENETDLSNVTERRLIYYTQSNTYPSAFPLIIEEKCLDLATGQELLIHKTINTYTNQAKISRQEHYDSQNQLAYILTWQYDAMGNILQETDAIGRTTTHKYDINGNCIFTQGPRQDCFKSYAYDFMNRLIKEEEHHNDGIVQTISHRYDYAGNRIATIDKNGNETQFTYDAFGRVTQIIYPLVLDEAQHPYHPIISKNYDLMGQVTAEIDGRGNITQKNYTLRGQLSNIAYPDGTTESNLYNLDGTLKRSTAKNGTYTTYTYDSLDRPIKTEVWAANGEQLATTSTTYTGFHLLSETDPMGIVTTYSYYPSGKLKTKQRGNSLISYTYDTLGRLNITSEYYGPSATDVIVKGQKYDNLDRIVEETVEDAQGNILTCITYTFDLAGNICGVTTYPGGVASTSTSNYDSHGVATTFIDAEGNQTHTRYLYDYRNALGQYVTYKEVTDAMGNQLISIHDALGRNVTLMRKNAFGDLIQKQEITYDANGNCRTFIDTIISPAGENQLITLMDYDSSNRLIACYEALGTPVQKQTKITYDNFGQKLALIKGDGISLIHTYDAMGRLSTLNSSDQSIHYTYQYDRNSNPLKVEDLINGQKTLKNYDANGRLTSETLGNNLTIQYAYDQMGRPTLVTLPDNSCIGYSYQACYLQSVSRINSQNENQYTHTYDSFDLTGKLTAATLIGNGGPLTHTYDILGRLIETKTTTWQENLTRYDGVGNLLAKHIKKRETTFDSSFAYDNLYQITQEEGISSHLYAYDSHYNRLSKDGLNQTLNALNQLVDDGTYRYLYDLNGNIIEKISDEASIQYSYDALDRLVKLVNGTTTTTYTYDENNRRLTKTVSGEETSNYLYQGQNEIGSCDITGVIKELRLLGLGKGAEIGAAISMEIGNKIYIPIHDHTGSVISLLDSVSGEEVESYTYTTFGEELFENALTPWRFNSKRTDSESGLVYFGRRYYAPEIGRWLTCDPLGREGGPNLYAYVLNSPLTHFDLYGLYGLSEFFEGSKEFFNGLFSSVKKTTFDFNEQQKEQREQKEQKIHFDQQYLNMEYNWSEPEIIYVGTRRIPDKGVGFTNGIATSRKNAIGHAELLSSMADGYQIDLVHNASNGAYNDVIRYLHSVNHIASKAVSYLHSSWDTYFDNSSPDASYLQFCHSEGVVNVRNALMSYDKERRQRISVAAFAPSVYISRKYCNSIDHYASSRDFVPLFDSDGRAQNKHSTHILAPHVDAPWFDHDFQSPTYRFYLNEHISSYLN